MVDQRLPYGVAAGAPETILVIEDETIMREACRDILSEQGYRVLTAADGAAGIELAKADPPDLALVDIRMPGIEGLEVLRLIGEADPSIIKIVITGYATIEYAVASMRNGAYDFLPKPFTPEELRLIVSRGLERRRLIAEREAALAEKKKMTDFFISIVSHQLQSPLSAVKQYFEVILGDMAGPVSPEARDIITKADRRMDDLIALIGDWLSFARFDPARVREGFTELDVAAIIRRHLEFLAPLITEGGVTATLAVDGDPPRVAGDERSLGEAFSNLISNAVKYNRPGGTLAVSVTVRRSAMRRPVCRHRHRHTRKGHPADLLRVLPGQGPRHEGDQGDGAGPGDRQEDRRGPRRHDRFPDGIRAGDDVHGQAAGRPRTARAPGAAGLM